MAEKTAARFKKEIIAKMESLKTYKPEFDNSITILGQMLLDYDRIKKTFEDNGCEYIVPHTNKAGAENYEQNPYFAEMEILRKDILIYLRELGLTPSALKNIIAEDAEKVSPLAAALIGLEL